MRCEKCGQSDCCGADSSWISVDERLPKKDQEVFISDGIRVCNASAIYRGEVWYTVNFRDGGLMTVSPVSYWMPLPEPPTSISETDNE